VVGLPNNILNRYDTIGKRTSSYTTNILLKVTSDGNVTTRNGPACSRGHTILFDFSGLLFSRVIDSFLVLRWAALFENNFDR